eukprot:g5919.t1
MGVMLRFLQPLDESSIFASPAAQGDNIVLTRARGPASGAPGSLLSARAGSNKNFANTTSFFSFLDGILPDPLTFLSPSNLEVPKPNVDPAKQFLADAFGEEALDEMPESMITAGKALFSKYQPDMEKAAADVKNSAGKLLGNFSPPKVNLEPPESVNKILKVITAPIRSLVKMAGGDPNDPVAAGKAVAQSLGPGMGKAVKKAIEEKKLMLSTDPMGALQTIASQLASAMRMLGNGTELTRLFSPLGPRFNSRAKTPAQLAKLEKVRMKGLIKLVGAALKMGKVVFEQVVAALKQIPKILAALQLALKLLKEFIDNLPNPLEVLADLIEKLMEYLKFFIEFVLSLWPLHLGLLLELLKALIGMLKLGATDLYPMDVFIPAQPIKPSVEDQNWMFMRKKYPLNGRVMGEIGAPNYKARDDPRPAKLILERADFDLEKARRAYERAEEYAQRADMLAKQAKVAADAVLKLQADSAALGLGGSGGGSLPVTFL